MDNPILFTPVYNDAGIDEAAITWALGALKDKADQYELYRRYYRGEHKLDFITEKFKSAFGKALTTMKANLCPSVIDIVADRLQVNTFSVKLREKVKTKLKAATKAKAAVNPADAKPDNAAAEEIAAQALEIWEMNRMDTRAFDVMKEGLKCGDAYVIVWPDPQADNEPVLYPQEAGACAVGYHEEKPGFIVRAAKWWKTSDKKIRVTVYYADRIEKYITKQPVEMLPEKAGDFERFVVTDPNDKTNVRELWPLANTYGKCPVFHFPNGKERESELANILELQDATNLTLCNLLVSMEFFAFPQRYGIGVEDDDNDDAEQWKAAMDRLWTISAPDGKFGQFDPSSPAPYLDVLSGFRNVISIIKGIPPHYFEMKGGDIPSGVALQILESRLTKKIGRLQKAWGNVWADVMLFSLQIIIANLQARLKTEWEDTEPHDAKSEAETQEIKQRTGVSKKQSLREQGYSDQKAEEMLQDNADQQQSAADSMGKLFNAGAV